MKIKKKSDRIILIPMAGKGMRVANYEATPKPLIQIEGKTLIEHAVDSLGIKGNYFFIAKRHQSQDINKSQEQTINALKVSSSKIFWVDNYTNGPTETCLYAKDFINNDSELIITNCDQSLNWDSNDFFLTLESNRWDGALLVFRSKSPQHSYVQVDSDGLAVRVREKEVISELALVGLHYWRKGADFVRSAEKLIAEKNVVNGEYYVAPTYNYLIQEGKKIGIYEINQDQYVSLGSSLEIEDFLNKRKEL